MTQKKNNRLLAVYLDLTVGTLEDSTLSNRNTSTMSTLGSVPFVYKVGMPVYRYLLQTPGNSNFLRFPLKV